jgi:hypothetical protein
VIPMPDDRTSSPNHTHLSVLLAEARRDDLLETAARARLAAQIPRVRRGRLRALLAVALARATWLARGSARRRNTHASAAQAEPCLPIKPRCAPDG